MKIQITKEVANHLIQSHGKAAERSRQVFIILNIVSVILAISYFNYKYSWLTTKENRVAHNMLLHTDANFRKDIAKKYKVEERQISTEFLLIDSLEKLKLEAEIEFNNTIGKLEPKIVLKDKVDSQLILVIA